MHSHLSRRAAMQWAGAGLALPATAFPSSRLENEWMPFAPKFVDLVRNVATVSGRQQAIIARQSR